MLKSIFQAAGIAAVVCLSSTWSSARGEDPKPDAGWASISGKVTWAKADAAPRKEISPPANPDLKHCLSNGNIPDEMIVVDPATKGVQNVFVYVKLKKNKKIHPSYPQTAEDVKKADEEAFQKENGFSYADAAAAIASGKTTVDKLKAPVVLDQQYCRYLPHALAFRQGRKLLVKNPEPVNHNVNIVAFDDQNKQNVNMPPKTIQFVELSSETGVIPVECNVHPWMKMYIMVFEHPYFAVTGVDGSFSIKNIPPGDHTLVLRNSNGLYIEKDLKVSLAADEVKTVDVQWSK